MNPERKMIPVNSTSMIPPGLKNYLLESNTPWNISAPLFARISQQPWEAGGVLYKRCQVLLEDPECQFILKYFNHQMTIRGFFRNVA